MEPGISYLRLCIAYSLFMALTIVEGVNNYGIYLYESNFGLIGSILNDAG